MDLKVNTFYRVKDKVDGKETPKGYFYVIALTNDTVKFIITPEPKITGGAGSFTMKKEDFLKMIILENRYS